MRDRTHPEGTATINVHLSDPLQQLPWPADFFDTDLSADELAELRDAGDDLESAIYAARRDTDVAPL